MHSKPCPLFWRIIGGPPQSDNRIKRIFSAAAMREHAAPAWPIAFTAIHNPTSTDPALVRAFLDSRYGRHFANGVNGQMHYGASLAEATAKTTAECMGRRHTPRSGAALPRRVCPRGSRQ